MHACTGTGLVTGLGSDQAKLARPGPALYRLIRPSLKKKNKIKMKNWAWTSDPADPILFM